MQHVRVTVLEMGNGESVLNNEGKKNVPTPRPPNLVTPSPPSKDRSGQIEAGAEHLVKNATAHCRSSRSSDAGRPDPPREQPDRAEFILPLGIQSWIKDGSRLVLHQAVRNVREGGKR
jgi:hypothetical protein